MLFDADVGGLPCLRMKWTLDAVTSDSSGVRDVLMDESHILIMLVRFLLLLILVMWDDGVTECFYCRASRKKARSASPIPFSARRAPVVSFFRGYPNFQDMCLRKLH